MRTTILITLLLSTILTQASELRVGSEIRSVRVFQQGAEIVRTANVQLPVGSSEVIIDGLSSSANSSSVQVKLSEGSILLNNSFRLNYLGGKKFTEAVRSIKDSIALTDIELRKTKAQIHSLMEEESFITANKMIGGKDAPLTVAELKAVSEFAGKRIKEIHLELISHRNEEARIQKRLNKLNKQLSEYNATHKTPSGELVLSILTEKPLTAELEITYLVQNAGWVPAYDLRSDGIDAPVMLTYKAQVYQNTGIDWSGVDLVISTANPSVSQDRPVMHPWYIDFMEALIIQSYGGGRQQLENMAILKDSYGNDDAELYEGGVGTYTWLQQNQLNEEFVIELQYDIPSDNKQHTVNMKVSELKAKYQYHAVPKLDCDAFLLAKVTDWEQLSLLAGNANLFFENSFIGTSYINPNMTSDTLLLSLGRDKRINIQRELMEDFTSKKFIGGNVTAEFSYKITVRNTKQQSLPIEILEQIPISKNKEIQVQLVDGHKAKYTQEYGRLKWSFDLKPNETKELNFRYSVKYPKEKVIPGI